MCWTCSAVTTAQTQVKNTTNCAVWILIQLASETTARLSIIVFKLLSAVVHVIFEEVGSGYTSNIEYQRGILIQGTIASFSRRGDTLSI